MSPGPRRGPPRRPNARRSPPDLPAPSAEAFRALGPYARTRLVERALGQTLSLDVPGDVFSWQQIDDGTLLLLENLPEGDPRSVLDLGCGYGALGLPVALRWPLAQLTLIDRDLLAVAAAAHNARALGLGNVRALPGLGYRDLPREACFDWVLCNVPARIGARAIRALLEGGRALLSPGGEMRVVVIRDLAPVLESLGFTGPGGLAEVAHGPRHHVFVLPAGSAPAPLDHEEIYARDETRFEGLTLARPHDVSEDPTHLPALAKLAQSLPRQAAGPSLFFRAGYGALPLCAAARWPTARLVAQERDLLDAAFLRRNARALLREVEVRETLFPADGLPHRSFAHVFGELSPAAGPRVAARELQDAADLLAPGGEGLVLASEKMEQEWFPGAAPRGAQTTLLLRREGASVLRISRPRDVR